MKQNKKTYELAVVRITRLTSNDVFLLVSTENGVVTKDRDWSGFGQGGDI
ncbi:MAG: hypothetical protein IJ506_07220 [Clostridia bacterium]|nr:hypothetical protein [Clostridia bacterium]